MPFDFDANPLTLSGLFPETTAPIQVDIYGYCQMACFYCFSNLNKDSSGRRLNQINSTPALLRQLDHVLADPEDPLGWLLRDGYFVGFSNTTDPFQREEKRYRSSEAFLQWAAAHEHPLFIETKGNVLLEEWDRYAPLLAPGRTAVYISLTTLDPKVARKIEPGAMPPADRLELMRRLAARGCGVIAACNPYVPAWVPDLDAYCEAVRDAGASDVFPFYLHFTENQAEHIPACYRSEVERANLVPAVQAQGFRRWREACDLAGLRLALSPFWDAYFGYPSGEFTAERALQGRGEQVHWFHNFVKWVAQHSSDHGGAATLFSWRTFEKYLSEIGLPNPVLKTAAFNSSWINNTDGHKEFSAVNGKRSSLYGLLRWLWNNPWLAGMRGVWSDPHILALFDGGDGVYEADRNNDLIGVYLPKPTNRQDRRYDISELAVCDVAKMPD